LDVARDADGSAGNDFLSYRIGATATPLKNRLDDVFNLTEALGLFRAAFVYGGEAIRYASPSYVRDCLHKISVRRMIDDVIDLPPARFVPIRVNSNDTDLMRKLDATHDQLDAYLAALEQGVQGRMPFFSEMSRVKRELAEAKADATIARALEHINDGRQVVVFSDHRAVIDRLAKMAGWTTISGAVPKSAERIRRADAFRDGKYKGISCTIGAAREGINLQSAHVMIFCDLNWVPANNEQAFGRIRRRGQTKECLYELMIIGHPLDRRIAEINIRKEKLSREAITVTTPTARSVGEYVGRLDDAIANANV
jgi:hypothetical protein